MTTSASDSIPTDSNKSKVFNPNEFLTPELDEDSILHALASNDGDIVFKDESRETILSKMLKAGMDINVKNADGFTPLHSAVSVQSIIYIEMLLERGADIESEDNECLRPLHIACENGYLDIVQMLLERGAQIDARSNILVTPCMFTAAHGHMKCLAIMLERGANANAQDEKGFSCIHHAIDELHFDCVDLLLKYGADINIRNKYGRTPLMIAASHVQADAVVFLCERGANLEIKNEDGDTALQSCSQQQFSQKRERNNEQNLLKCAIILCDYGANINSFGINSFGLPTSPLAGSAKSGFKEICRLLLDRGAKLPSLKDLYGRNNYEPICMIEEKKEAADCRPMIALEYELRVKRKAFDFAVSHYIEYPFYKQSIYESCFPSGLRVTIPSVGFVRAEAIRDKYYYNEIFFVLNLWIAKVSFSQQSTEINSSLVASQCREHFASRSNKTAALMTVLSSYLKEFLHSNLMFCATCNSVGTLKCSKCKIFYYCSQECQKKHWGKHKQSCCSHNNLIC